jgi:hypothetical protein
VMTQTQNGMATVIGILLVLVGGLIGLLFLPVWIGFALGGVMGGWIGVIVEIGLIIAGVLRAILPQ